VQTIGIVIVNYHCADDVRRCIRSVKAHVRCASLSFVVVDNSRLSEEGAIRREHSDIVFLRSGGNPGFAGGCNLGIRHCLGQGHGFVLLLNPDTRVEHDFLAPLLAAMNQDRQIGAAGPKILYDTAQRDVWYGGAEMNWWRGGPKQIFDHRNDGRGPVQDMPCLSGCVMLLRAEALRAAGEMDESYFLYYEDTDYCLRLSAAGWRVVYVPAAMVLHAASATVGFQSAGFVYYFSRNRIWLMRRWAGTSRFLAYMLFNLLVKAPGAVIVFGLLRRKPELTVAYFKGIRDAFTKYPRNGGAVS